MHISLIRALGYSDLNDAVDILADWKDKTSQLCKPCWELQYCPYGPIVEESPLLPSLRESAVESVSYIRQCLEKGKLASGEELDEHRRQSFEQTVSDFNEEDYPEDIPQLLRDASCKVFGHMCPVFFVAEPVTETWDCRKHSRSIPQGIMLKVARRDGQICQICNEPVADNEVEFDHIIPFSKGGRSIAENLRVVHRNCNRVKSNSLEDLLHPKPIEHTFEWSKSEKNDING